MLRLSVSPGEYLMIGDDIKVVFLGGTKNHLRIMVDAPREQNIIRSKVLDQLTEQQEEKEKVAYHAATETKKQANVANGFAM